MWASALGMGSRAGHLASGENEAKGTRNASSDITNLFAPLNDEIVLAKGPAPCSQRQSTVVVLASKRRTWG